MSLDFVHGGDVCGATLRIIAAQAPESAKRLTKPVLVRRAHAFEHNLLSLIHHTNCTCFACQINATVFHVNLPFFEALSDLVLMKQT